MVNQMGAIIGGCAAGGVILVLVLAITIYMLCGKSKHRKKRQKSKFRSMSPPVSPGHSQPSSLGHNHPDARLPKVNSTGLWIESSSMYTGGPSPYYIGRGVPVPVPVKTKGISRLVPKASSETRLAQSGNPPVGLLPRPFYGSQSSLLLIPSQGGPRIFHSQPLTPLYEVPNRNDPMEIYDVYQFGAISKSKLVETKHSKSYYEDGFKLAPKLERSKSDAGQKSKHIVRSSDSFRSPSRHDRSPSRENERHGSTSRDNSRSGTTKSAESFREGRAPSRETSQKNGRGGHNNRAFSAEAEIGRASSIKEKVISDSSMISAHPKSPMPTSSVAIVATAAHSPPLVNGTPGKVSAIVEDKNDISSSATDSMKLLAKNKTDDQKTIVPLTNNLSSDKGDAFDSKDVDLQRYIYQGDIYAPSSHRNLIDGEEENPIIARMKNMVIEKSRNNNSSSPRESRVTADIYNIMHEPDHLSSTDVLRNNHSPIYNEMNTETRDYFKSKEHLDSEVTRGTKLADPANLSILDGIELPPASSIGDFNYKDSSITKEPQQPSSPVTMRGTETLTNGTDDIDGASDEINTAGKRITDSAFEFLNTYLSDDEAADD